jgi:hypothetical protein
MDSIRAALRESITHNDLPQLARVVDECQALGMNYFDMLTVAEQEVPSLNEDEWGDLVEDLNGVEM